MNSHSEKPIIIQSDRTILLEVDNPQYELARDELIRFAELVKSPEHIHTYRLTPLSLWNAAAAGYTANQILERLAQYSRYEIPANVARDIIEFSERYGKLKLMNVNGQLAICSADPYLIQEIWHQKSVQPFVTKLLDKNTILTKPQFRGHIKQALIKLGFPVEDLAGYITGDPLKISLKKTTQTGKPFTLRHYQQEAVDIFYANGSVAGGSGVIVLPCGAGKTIVGLGIIAKLQCATLILATNVVAVRQWLTEILDKTDISPDLIGEYSGEIKEIKPITVATYQILIYRPNTASDFPHFSLFNKKNWGLIIYDEVHLLPAPVFRITAEIQARRRLGLTATLVREDGKEDDVFSLIGPKRYDVPWKELEKQGWIATAECHEIRLNLPEHLRLEYAIADSRTKFRIASENPMKEPLVKKLVARHNNDQILIIGQYIQQLEHFAKELNAPIITGQTPNDEREKLYAEFRAGTIKLLVVSKVANFAIDLPDANVAIQISGTFGSRQEEAQRLGRILRPKLDGTIAHFYSIITRDTKEQDYAANRQLFLTEQGYKYTILDANEIE
ncbi:MAG: DEAD/DEAH box helicase [bacterium]|nr:DEAD/DEAH box helicase [bacterium]